MRTILGRLLAVVALLLGVTFVAAAPAQAVVTPSCGSGYTLISQANVTFGANVWGYTSLYYKASTKDACAFTVKTVASLVGVSSWTYDEITNSSGTVLNSDGGNFQYYSGPTHYTVATGRCYYANGTMRDLAGHTGQTSGGFALCT